MDRMEIFARLADGVLSREEALSLLKRSEAPCQVPHPATGPRTPAPCGQPSLGGRSLETIRGAVRDCVADRLHIDPDEVTDDLSFSEMGADSISGLEIVRELNVRYGLNLESTILYDYPHVGDLAAHIDSLTGDVVATGATFLSSPEQHQVPLEQVRTGIMDALAGILHLEPQDLDAELTFQEMGVDSISGLEVVRECNLRFGVNLDSVVLYDHPDLDDLASYIATQMDPSHEQGSALRDGDEGALRFESQEKRVLYHDTSFVDMRGQFLQGLAQSGDNSSGTRSDARSGSAPLKAVPLASLTADPTPAAGPVLLRGSDHPRGGARKLAPGVRSQKSEAAPPLHSTDGDAIAVIGMAGVFPDADDVEEFWDNLVNGVVSMRPVPKHRWGRRNGSRTYPDTIRPALLRGIDLFDPLFFNVSPIDAEIMDPQQRVFLQVAFHAFEHAGLSEDHLDGRRVGVWVGAGMGDYQDRLAQGNIPNQSQVFAGNASSILPARVSYYLNLRGPSQAIDTACSSSLVAIHDACQALRYGDVELALAGGIRLMVGDSLYMQVLDAGMGSPTGECRAFDARADGIAMGEAAAAVVLKRHADAIADGDRILGVILGSGVNQDGRTNGITAPSPSAQAELELEVYSRYDIDARDITLLEAHGTGTALGDPIEVRALQKAFSRYTRDESFCHLGSVKNNVGHTTMAAGITSLIKVLKAIEKKIVPPLTNFERLTDKIDLDGSPFRINTEAVAWEIPEHSRRVAALSSFGFSGTNCHMVVREAL
ncbi:MAG: hypothetical protein E7Z97_04000 [Propionibacteriaceae bacterium]|nr:type I polyketide synthase [Propionibacterium ruminifibrarum]MBE6477224.1 hypothetical protein [Propionibacteriaceae bacterium]